WLIVDRPIELHRRRESNYFPVLLRFENDRRHPRHQLVQTGDLTLLFRVDVLNRKWPEPDRTELRRRVQRVGGRKSRRRHLRNKQWIARAHIFAAPFGEVREID